MLDRTETDAILDCAVTAARAAGEHALKNTSRRREAVKTYAHDVKLRLDIECQALAEQIIRARYADHLILGEESVDSETEPQEPSRIQWIIDPIDGTVNFSHGMPMWCCSIAARQYGSVIAGAVYAPALNDLFTATIHCPSQRNGKPIEVSPTASLADSIIMTGLDKNLDPKLPSFEVFRAISASVQKARVIGSAALDICYVACGQADGYFESGIYLWDIAAGGLIVRQAGGMADIIGELPGHRLQFVATNGRIHAALKELLRGKLATPAG